MSIFDTRNNKWITDSTIYPTFRIPFLKRFFNSPKLTHVISSGLNDIKNKPIYDGDILIYQMKTGNLMKVYTKFKEGAFRVYTDFNEKNFLDYLHNINKSCIIVSNKRNR